MNVVCRFVSGASRCASMLALGLPALLASLDALQGAHARCEPSYDDHSRSKLPLLCRVDMTVHPPSARVPEHT